MNREEALKKIDFLPMHFTTYATVRDTIDKLCDQHEKEIEDLKAQLAKAQEERKCSCGMWI